MDSQLSFQCAVCKGAFQKKADWLNHFLRSPHDELSRLELVKNWGKEDKMKLILVISSLIKKPTSSGGLNPEEILNYFEREEPWSEIMTDFTWWEERAGVAFIKFGRGHREKVSKLLWVMKNQQVSINGQIFKLKFGEDILDSEWDILLPLTERGISGSLSSSGSTPPGPGVKEVCRGESQSQGASEPKRSRLSPMLIVKDKPHHSDRVDKPLPSRKPDGPGPSLNKLLTLIQTSVEVPPDGYKAAEQLVNLLNSLLSQEFPNCQVFLIRNWSFKLKYHPINFGNPLFFAINQTPGSIANRSSLNFQNFTFSQLLTKTSAIQLAPSDDPKKPGLPSKGKLLSSPSIKYELSLDYARREFPSLKNIFPTSSQKKFRFWLGSHPILVLEAQLWRLAHHLCAFDSRCDSLLQIVYYWANVNLIRLGWNAFLHPEQDPIGLTWLVLFFLSCKQIIPPPDLILEENHPPMYYKRKLTDNEQLDIGFSQDLSSQKQKWTAKMNKSSVPSAPEHPISLAVQFFYFWNKFSEGNWIILTREAAYYEVNQFLKLTPEPGASSSSISRHLELQSILERKIEEKTSKKAKAQLFKTFKMSQPSPPEDGDQAKGLFYMTDPLNPFRDIPILSHKFPLMGKTGKKLEQFIHTIKNGNEANEIKLTRKFLRELFTIS